MSHKTIAADDNHSMARQVFPPGVGGGLMYHASQMMPHTGQAPQHPMSIGQQRYGGDSDGMGYRNNPFLNRTPPLNAATPQAPAWNAPMASNFQSSFQQPTQAGMTMPTPTFF